MIKLYKNNDTKYLVSDRIPINFTGISVYQDGEVHHWKDGQLHRLNGPAIECYKVNNNYYEYWLFGKQYNVGDYWIENNKIIGVVIDIQQ